MPDLVVHASVAALWWLRHLPVSDDAAKLVESVARHRFSLRAPDTFEADLLGEIVDDLSDVPGGLASELATGLLADVQEVTRSLVADERLKLVRHRMLVPGAFLMATKCSVTMRDAIYFSTALTFGCHLIIVDDALIEGAARVSERYPELLVTHVSNVHDLDA